MVRLTVFIIIFSTAFSCKNQELTIERGNYEYATTPLKIDGLYYNKGGISYDNRDLARIFFFYRNGVVFGGALTDFNTLMHDTESNLSRYDSIERRTVLGWGIYHTKYNNILEFEKWEPSSGGGAKTNVYHAKVLNDTTFVIEQIYSHYDEKIRSAQDTFKFFHVYSKPDSTNRFIKE